MVNGPSVALSLLRVGRGKWTGAALERFDWKGAVVRRAKNQKRWDAIEQLIRYKEVAGREVPISIQSIQSGELFIEPPVRTDRP
jgi:hypothetical protein